MERRFGPKPSPAMLVAIGAIVVALGGGAYAATTSIPDASGVIHACYSRSGAVRFVPARKRCAKSERAVTFNQRGPQGTPGPQGAQGQPVAQGQPGLPGPKGDAGDAATTLWASVDSDGTLLRGSGVTAATHSSLGNYVVTFNRDVSACVYTPSEMETAVSGFNAASHLVAKERADPKTVGVFIYNTTLNGGTGGSQDRSFSLLVTC